MNVYECNSSREVVPVLESRFESHSSVENTAAAGDKVLFISSPHRKENHPTVQYSASYLCSVEHSGQMIHRTSWGTGKLCFRKESSSRELLLLLMLSEGGSSS